jgi:hypothetical protein
MSSTPKEDDAATTGEAGGSAPSCGSPTHFTAKRRLAFCLTYGIMVHAEAYSGLPILGENAVCEELIEVRISDSMAVATMLERWNEISKESPHYSLAGSRRAGSRSTIYRGTRSAWESWAKHCRDNAEGALDFAPDRKLNAQAAERIEAAISAGLRG